MRKTPQLHPAGLPWASIHENPRLLELFRVLSLSVDRQGKVYVSTMEASKYPITATQWWVWMWVWVSLGAGVAHADARPPCKPCQPNLNALTEAL